MQIYVASDISQINISQEKWDQIVSNNETNTIFQTYQWFYCWWKVFHNEYKLFFISVYDNNQILGIAPLMISINPNHEKKLMFIGEGSSDYSDFIVQSRKEEVICKMFETIYSRSNEWDSICLNNIPANSSTVDIIKKICANNILKLSLNDNISCPTLLIKGYENDAIKVSNSKSLRRKHNFFKKNGSISFVNLTKLSDAVEYLPLFFSQHIDRWSITKYPSLFLNNKNRDFYKELMINILHRGWLLFSIVKFNNHPIAFHYGFDYNSKVIWYKPSFDINYSKRSPGKMLLKYLLEYSIHNKKDELDFTVGDEQFKSHFTNKKRKNIQIKIYKHSMRFFIDLGKLHIKRFIKKASNK